MNWFRQIEWCESTKKIIKMINIYSCIILGHIQPNVRNLGTPVFHGIFNRRGVRKQRNDIGQDKPTWYNGYRTKVWHVHARIWFSRIRIGKSWGMSDHFCSIICLESIYLVLTSMDTKVSGYLKDSLLSRVSLNQQFEQKTSMPYLSMSRMIGTL